MSTQLPQLIVSKSNPHLLAFENGEPYFMIGDTAWELLFRLTKDEVIEYLNCRQSQHFNMIWLCFLPECDCVRQPTRQGMLPLEYEDPLKLNPKYVEWTNWVIGEAAKRHLYVGLLPTWGDKMTAPWGAGPVIFDDTMVAQQFGELIGSHFGGHSNIMWVMGGDRPTRVEKGSWVEQQSKDLHIDPNADWLPLWRAMIKGIHAKSPLRHLVTYHPEGGSNGTSHRLHHEDWLDLNCLQSGHGGGRDIELWESISRDYTLDPAKPTFDGEPNYEDHPVSPWPSWDPQNGYFDEYDVRRQIWRSVFAGSCGTIYGHHSVWNFSSENHRWINYAKMNWRQALKRPGAEQLRHLSALLNLVGPSRWQTLIPDQSVLADNGKQGHHSRAMMTKNESRIVIYSACGSRIVLRKSTALGRKASWFDPRSGHETQAESISQSEFAVFAKPNDIDWVLVLKA